MRHHDVIDGRVGGRTAERLGTTSAPGVQVVSGHQQSLGDLGYRRRRVRGDAGDEARESVREGKNQPQLAWLASVLSARRDAAVAVAMFFSIFVRWFSEGFVQKERLVSSEKSNITPECHFCFLGFELQ